MQPNAVLQCRLTAVIAKSLEMQHAALFLVALIACAHAVSVPLPRIVRISGQSFVTTATQVCLIETGN